MDNILDILNKLQDNVEKTRNSQEKTLFLKVILKAREKNKKIISHNKFICEGFVIEVSELSLKVYQNNLLVEFYFVEDKMTKTYFTNDSNDSLFYVQKTNKIQSDPVEEERQRAKNLLGSLNVPKSQPKQEISEPEPIVDFQPEPQIETVVSEPEPEPEAEQYQEIPKKSNKPLWISIAVCFVLVAVMLIYLNINNNSSNQIQPTQPKEVSIVQDYEILNEFSNDLIYHEQLNVWQIHPTIHVTSKTDKKVYCPFDNGKIVMIQEELGMTIVGIYFEDLKIQMLLINLDSSSVVLTGNEIVGKGDVIGEMAPNNASCPVDEPFYVCISIIDENSRNVNPLDYDIFN